MRDLKLRGECGGCRDTLEYDASTLPGDATVWKPIRVKCGCGWIGPTANERVHFESVDR